MRVWKVVVLVESGARPGPRHRLALVGPARRDGWPCELEAARTAAVPAGEREFRATGVVRAGLTDVGLLVITHGDIPGYMPPMTMGFRTASPKILESVKPGDAVRFTLRGTPPNLAITAIEKTAP